MQIKGIIWVGLTTDNQRTATAFFSDLLGMSLVSDIPGLSRLEASNGDRLELFGPDSSEHNFVDSGPVAGLWVEDCAVARAELIAAGVDEVTGLFSGADGHRWFYFRSPDGHHFEMCENPHPRQQKGPAEEVDTRQSELPSS